MSSYPLHLYQYMDEKKLSRYLNEGLVECRYHNDLPLRLLIFSREVHHNGPWDDVTTKCRGLIVGPKDRIIARPFEKFFNLNTSDRPETHLSNLPHTQPIITDKVDGSLGILYEYNGYSGIATKGSFNSDQAKWATEWYRQCCPNAQWPEGFTPIFEIINERIQHHVVHYHGREKLILLALINVETGEEADYNTLYYWAKINGLEAVEVYSKTVGTIINEDRQNREGYVLSWPRPSQPPLKIKVKHQSFLDLQKIVHAATPKAILEALESRNIDVLNTWIGQTNEPVGMWVKNWVTRLNWKFAEILLKNRNVYTRAMYECAGKALASGELINKHEARKKFAEIVTAQAPNPAICFAILDDKDHEPLVWKEVAKVFEPELAQSFALSE